MERAALKILSEKRLIKVNIEDEGPTLYLVYGTKFDKMYLLVPPSFCSCSSFYFNVFSRKLSQRCVHLAAYEASDHSIPEVSVRMDYFKDKLYPLIFKGLLS